MDLRDLKEFLIDTFKYIVTIAFIIFIVVYVCSLQQVVGHSMEPNLNDSDILLLDKVSYRIKNPKRFDLVTFKYDNNSQYLIKRVIGLPGENIVYKDNVLYVNGVEYQENFLTDDVQTIDFSLENLGYTTIPENMYLVLGDNRDNSIDSRYIGLISADEIIGKPLLRIWPIKDVKVIK